MVNIIHKRFRFKSILRFLHIFGIKILDIYLLVYKIKRHFIRLLKTEFKDKSITKISICIWVTDIKIA